MMNRVKKILQRVSSAYQTVKKPVVTFTRTVGLSNIVFVGMLGLSINVYYWNFRLENPYYRMKIFKRIEPTTSPYEKPYGDFGPYAKLINKFEQQNQEQRARQKEKKIKDRERNARKQSEKNLDSQFVDGQPVQPANDEDKQD